MGEDPGPDERALASVLDALVPPSDDGRLPGAGALGLAPAILARAPELRPLLAQGLPELDALARRRGVPGFAALPVAERGELLNELEAAQPGFLGGLVFHTYVAYYESGAVLEGLGLEARPPYPQGYELEAGDLGRLDAVRRRGARYRPV